MSGTLDILYDPEDEAIFQSRKWHISDSGYAVWRGVINGRRQTIRLHRLINRTPEGFITDHKNGNKLDNRRSNLRTVTYKENAQNKHGAKGYCWDESKKKWMVRYKNTFYGRYNTENEAKRAYTLAKSGIPYIKSRRKRWNYPTGVFKNKTSANYQARIQLNGEKIYLGVFKNIEDARCAYLMRKRG